jgi:cytochrome c oxidase subunit 2
MTFLIRLSDVRAPLLLALAGLAAFLPWRAPANPPVERTVRIEAQDFAFTPGTIGVNPGDRVTIELASGDYVHGLHIEGYDVNLIADPGRPASATFVADRPGTFRLRCSVTCGSLHPFMTGRLRVGPPVDFVRSLVLAALAVLAGGMFLARPEPAGGESRAAP